MKQLGAPVIIIDASNVCRDRDLAPLGVPASWARLEALLHALEGSPIVFSNAYVVADRTLHYALDSAGQQALRRMEKAGAAEQRRFADERIVELAYASTSHLRGALIATQDQFDDFRRSYEEITSTTGRAVRWRADKVGRPVPEQRDFESRTHQRMSRKEEEGEIAQRRLRRQDVQQRAVATYFRCTNRSCLVAKLWPDRLEELPGYDEQNDRFACPSCGAKLEVGDRRAPAVQVIVLVDGVERTRLLLEEGVDLDVGRVDAKGCVGLERHTPKGRAVTLSRRHLQLRLRGTDVTATDLDSKNGTWIRPRRAHDGHKRRLKQRSPEPWQLRDAVVLPGGITLERSGRRHPLVGQRPPGDGDTNPRAAPTTLVSPTGRR